MSGLLSKFLKGLRRFKTETHILKQVKIAKSHKIFNKDTISQPHRYAKHHVMDCGTPNCYLCGNPRKTHKDKLTAQEKRLFQDLENPSGKHSNGLSND